MLVRAKPSASVLLLRNGHAGLEVLMVLRHGNIEFAGNALVFPGGKVDTADRRLAFHKRNTPRLNTHIRGRINRIAVTRELFEETGVLIARSARTRRFLSESRRRRLAARWQKSVDRTAISFDRFLAFENLVLSPQDLQPFANWITPKQLPKRYDTHFYLAKLPRGQQPLHDGRELVASVWVSPKNVVEEAARLGADLMFPTRMNLMRLAFASSVEDAFRRARTIPIVPVMPKLEKQNGQIIPVVPPHCGYPTDAT
ncbi:MAG: NUDIX hydrolase [Pseudomonadota bacterium]